MADELSLDFFKQKGTEEGVIDTSKKVKIGIIGTDWIAANHIRSEERRVGKECSG